MNSLTSYDAKAEAACGICVLELTLEGGPGKGALVAALPWRAADFSMTICASPYKI